MEYINEPVRISETNYLSFCGNPCTGDTDKNCTGCQNDTCSPVAACNEGCKHKGWWGWCIEAKEAE